MVTRFFTLCTPFTSLTSLLSRSFSAAYVALPLNVTRSHLVATVYPFFLLPLFQVFPEAEVSALVFAAAELSPEAVVLAAGPEVFALPFAAAVLSP